MENNSDLNNQAARYTLCFNDCCAKAESCLRHSMTQYNTAKNIRLSVINPLCYPEAGKECTHFRTNKKIRVAWGFKNLYDDMPARISRAIHLNLEAVFNHSPYYRYRNQKLGLTPKQQECIRQVCRKHGWNKEIAFDRYTEVRLVGIPPAFPCGTADFLPHDILISNGWYKEYQPLVRLVPYYGTRRTTVGYRPYHAEVRDVPKAGTPWYIHRSDRQ